MRSFLFWTMAAALLVLVAACERPFVAPRTPEVEVVAPDFTTAIEDASTPLQVRASSFRPIDRVEVNGRLMTFVPDADAWLDTLTLAPGLNTLVVTAYDVAEVAGRDTVYALRLTRHQASSGPSLPAPLGGHAAALLADGSLLITGGASATDAEAQATAYRLPAGGAAFATLDAPMQAARLGHTATHLPDGRVLVLGGSRQPTVTGIDDLVEQAELYDPRQGRFVAIPTDGPPVRRAFHTAQLRVTATGTLIDLYGGRGDLRYEPDPRLGTRRDLRTFLLRNDSLISLSPAIGLELEAIAGHTQTDLTERSLGTPGRALIAGTFFGDGITDPVSLVLDFSDPLALLERQAPDLLQPRTRHTSVLLRSGVVYTQGGYAETPDRPLDAPEVYVEVADRRFRLPERDAAQHRYGHTATKSSAGRILLTGGFSSNGTGLASSEYVDLDF